jgi:isopenicillin-N epimerase
MMPNWDAIIDSVYKAPGLTYLNAGSISITPKVTYEKAVRLRERLHANPVDYVWRTSGQPLWEARCRLAQFVGTSPQRLLFVQNVSQAINFVASSITLAAPGEILMSDHEYGAMRWAWERAAQRLRLPIRIAKLPVLSEDPAALVESITQAFTPQTRLLFLSHVLYTMGLILPLKEICAAARKQGILTVIDGAHAPGMIPLHLDELGADFYATNLHKWFMAPNGSGFLYVAPGLEDRIQPWQVSWGWKYDRAKMHERDPYGGSYWQRSYEFEGTRDITPWLTVDTTADFHDAIGKENVRQRHHELSDLVRGKLHGLEGLQLSTPKNPLLRGGLTAFKMPPAVNGHLARKHLWEKEQIEINLVDHLDGPYLRTSTHIYNSPADIEKLARCIPEAFVAGRKK